MNYAVIMGGGRGTRFWPKSTNEKPKQFLTITGNRSLLRNTVDRLKKIVPTKNILLIGNHRHVLLSRKELPELPVQNIISEPIGRNTAPCLGLASLIVKKRDNDGVIIAAPADATISNEKRYVALMKAAVRYAQKEPVFVTLGVKPCAPHTGYGYIETSTKCHIAKPVTIYNVHAFHEKPTRRKAQEYVRRGNYYWNSGMYVFHVDTLLTAIKSHMPQLFAGLQTIKAAVGTRKEKSVLARVFKKLKPMSIDYGIMEKVSNVALIKADIGWNDVGSWTALDEVCKKDREGNVITGCSVVVDSRNNIIDAHNKIIALAGITDTIVVQTDSAVLIAHKNNAQDIKKIVAQLEHSKLRKYL